MEQSGAGVGGQGFIDWYAFDHPQLGPVELGGWDRWSRSSPPHHLILPELERNTQWVLTFAEKVPRLEVIAFEAKRIGNSHRFQIQTKAANVGWMATATDYAQNVLKTAQPVRVAIQLQGVELSSGEPMADLGVLPGARDEGPRMWEISWEVILEDPNQEGIVRLRVQSQKAGTVMRDLKLAPPSR